MNSQANTETDSQTETETNSQTEIETDSHTDEQTGSQARTVTDTQIEPGSARGDSMVDLAAHRLMCFPLWLTYMYNRTENEDELKRPKYLLRVTMLQITDIYRMSSWQLMTLWF